MSKNWMQWCRLCAREDLNNTHVNVFLEDQKGLPLSGTINKCLAMSINFSDGYPKTICDQCFSLAKSIINLAQRASRAQAMFSELMHGDDSLNANEIKVRYELEPTLDVKFDLTASSVLTNVEALDFPEIPIEMKEQMIDLGQVQYMETNDELNTTAIKIEETDDEDCLDDNLPEKESSDEEYSSASESDSKYTRKKRKRKLGKKHKSKKIINSKTKVTPHYCSGCDKGFKTHSGYVRHMKREHDVTIEPIPPVLVCEICGKSYKTVGSLKEHKQTHSMENTFKCTHCEKSFNNQNSLRRHEDTHNGTNYICVVCGLQLNTKRTLQTHMVVHSDQKKYKCDLCGNEYKRAKALKYHLLTHTGLKPFLCDFCDKTFSTAVNCRLHLKRHHPVEFAQQEAAGKNQVSKAVVPELKELKAELIRRHREQQIGL